jgi:hypothetical protein
MAKPLLDMSAARVFFDGIFTSPRVAHPEGVAVHRDGSIWCGTETGNLLRLAADGDSVECMGGTDGFVKAAGKLGTATTTLRDKPNSARASSTGPFIRPRREVTT